MVASVVRQRDMYRALLAEADQRYSRTAPGGVSSPSAARGDARAIASPAGGGGAEGAGRSTALVLSEGHGALSVLEQALRDAQDDAARARAELHAAEESRYAEVDKHRQDAAHVRSLCCSSHAVPRRLPSCVCACGRGVPESCLWC
jgi:hypothetical protein